MPNPHRTRPDAVDRERPTTGYGSPPGPQPRTGPRGPDGDFSTTGGGDWGSRHGAPPPPRSSLDFSALVVLLDGLRRAAPAELQGRLTGLIREALLTLRSLIDWYLERLEHPPREPRVEDIPID